MFQLLEFWYFYDVLWQSYTSQAIFGKAMTCHYMARWPLNALSCIRFIFLLRLRLWNIQTNKQYSSCDSIKAFIIILFLSTFMKGARRTRALSFWYAFLQRLLTCYSWKYLLRIWFNGMPSISFADGSLQLKRMWLSSLLAFIKLLLNHVKSGSDDVFNVLITDRLFVFFNCIYCSVIRIICNI